MKDEAALIKITLTYTVSDILCTFHLRMFLPFSHNDISTGLHHGHSVRIEQLPVSLPDLSELELEPPLLVKYLDPMVVGVRHYYVILCVDSHAAWLCKLSLKDPKLSELAVVDHLLSLDLRFERIEARVYTVNRTVLNWSPWSHRRRAEASLGHQLG